ncbi:DUF2493 domain-containing protein [Streptomyces sp. NEAU-H3]|uniref:DUF2493 domain-containing protein n=1 Tax=Streptomyces sp. NEAU-H3 TaxID=2720636 RepID=UPI00143BCE6D|nr:DUF2493 domain-containing protein [Streptomyces sp. NEAU-H3]NJA56715.1 DUF2493 domain-containing protein [Streptomyces sp. NEAU-H3]
MTPYRILITGSRGWEDHDLVRAHLTAAVYQQVPAVIIHGGCPIGPDAVASWWVRQHRVIGLTEERHPADWKTHGRAAGPLRNTAMVGLGADLCLAFISPCTKTTCRRPHPHGSHGATNCADLAEQAGIPVRRFTA